MMADFESSLPVRTLDPIELQVKTKTGTSLSVTATDFDIRDLLYSQDSVQIWANTAKDGSGTDYIPIVNSDGRLEVVVASGGGGYQYQDGDSNSGAYGMVAMGDDGSNLQFLAVDVNGRLQVQVAVALPVGSNTIGKVYITDGVEDVAVDINNNLQVNLNAVGVTAVPISANALANSLTNPIYVKLTEQTQAGEVHDYDTAVDVAKDGTDNHDYTVSSGATLLLNRVLFSASGAMKVTVQVGPVGSLTTVAVGFTSSANPMDRIVFDPPVEITSGDIVRVARFNRDNQAMDVYSTIMGSEIT